MKKLNFWRTYLRILSYGVGLRPLIGLVPILTHPDSELRWHAADVLSWFSDEEIVEPVFKILQQEPDPHVRKRLVWVLENGKAWDKLFLCLDFLQRDVRSQATTSLSRSGETRFVVPLLRRMQKGGGEYDNYSEILYGIVDKSSVKPLLNFLLSAPSPKVRGTILTLLGITKDRQVFDFLVEALNDKNEEVREGAILGLMELEDTRAITPLQKLNADPSENIRELTEMILKRLEELAAKE